MKASGVLLTLAIVAVPLYAVGKLGWSEVGWPVIPGEDSSLSAAPPLARTTPDIVAQAQTVAPATVPSAATVPSTTPAVATSPATASQAVSPEPAAQIAATPATDPAAASGPKVDETALRYFAMRGDTKRLEAEIARLRALYPGWSPPADPLAVAPHGDAKLDAMWKLYAEGKYVEVRKAIADRQASEPKWQVPTDLADRLSTAEARVQLINSSDLKQYDAVLRIGAANPSLLTCGDVDVLWRLAEAFAKTERQDRAKDAYLYVLNNCTDTAERLATVQKALPLISRANLDTLLATEKTGPDGVPEFAPVRIDIARQSVASGNADASIAVAPGDLKMVEDIATKDGLASDALLLGWHHVVRENPEAAEKWFRKARELENTASASQGLALALVDLGQPFEAEDILYEWRDTDEEVKAVYLAAVANMLSEEANLLIPEDILKRVVPEVYEAKDIASAQQLGWYADSMNQFETAAQWFQTVLRWKPDDEPSAYGLALMNWKLGNMSTVAQIQRNWAGRSDRIATVGQPQPEDNRNPATAALPAPTGDATGTGPKRRTPKAYPEPNSEPAGRTPPTGRVAPTRVPPSRVSPIDASPEGTSSTKAGRIRAAAPVAETSDPQAPANDAPVRNAPARSAPLPKGTSAETTDTVRETPIQVKGTKVRQLGCASPVDPKTLAPESALTRAWCLMGMNRPVEAAAAFEVALGSSSEKSRQDAAYGQSLAYLRAGLSDHAAVAATKAPIDHARSIELQTALLSDQAAAAFDSGRYVETLMALDERARIAPERVDLMVLRGYAYIELRRYDDAMRTFRAAAGTGSRDAMRGLAILAERRAFDRN